MPKALVELGHWLQKVGYNFTPVSPPTHRLINARSGCGRARSLRDIFGWSRQFEAGLLPAGVLDLLREAGACEQNSRTELWNSRVRFASLDGLLFAHSAFPTVQNDAVFFGPDTIRFVHAIKQRAPAASRVVDVGSGSGVGGIVLAQAALTGLPIVLADINPEALRLGQINAELANVPAEVVESDVLDGVDGLFDLVISNPPYLVDDQSRLYCHGGGERGEELAIRIVREGVERLRSMPRGGVLLMYTGSAVVDGVDTFLASARGELTREGVTFSYDELDPDVCSDELERAAYRDVERIAAVLLEVRVAPAKPRSTTR